MFSFGKYALAMCAQILSCWCCEPFGTADISNHLPRMHTDFCCFAIHKNNCFFGLEHNLAFKRGTVCFPCSLIFLPLCYITKVLTLIYHFVWGPSASEWKGSITQHSLGCICVCVCTFSGICNCRRSCVIRGGGLTLPQCQMHFNTIMTWAVLETVKKVLNNCITHLLVLLSTSECVGHSSKLYTSVQIMMVIIVCMMVWIFTEQWSETKW